MITRFCLIIIVLVALAGAAHAQPTPTPGISTSNYVSKAQRETKFMEDSLALTPVQVGQVTAANTQYFKDLALLEGQAISVAERKQRKLQHEAEWDSTLRTLLTEVQYNRYKALVKAQQDRMKARLGTTQIQ